MVKIGTRIEEKEKTRNKIINATTELIQKRGFVKISSKEIAKTSQVSQGSIFVHFKTKEGLLFSILESNIDLLQEDLEIGCKPVDKTDMFLKSYVDIIAKHESILSRIYKDYSYLDSNLQKKIDGLEVILKNLIFENYKKNSKTTMSIVDSFIAIDAFLSQTKEYLISKDTFSSSNSILRQKRGRIAKLHKMLFQTS